MKPVTGLVCAAITGTWVLTSIAQVPEPPPVVFGSGGGSSVSGATYLYDTVGQAAIGPMTTSSEFHGAGFWYEPDLLHIGPTTAVLIESFAAAVTSQGVQLEWRISSADGLQGFHLYRSRDATEDYAALNDASLLPPGTTSFLDTEVRPGQSYGYRLGAVDGDGEFFSPVQTVVLPHRDVELAQNHPNPFNPTTRIDYYLPEDMHVVLTVYGVRGDRVATLVDEPTRYGHHSVTWNGMDARGMRVSSGVYFYRLRAGNKVITRKLVVMK